MGTEDWTVAQEVPLGLSGAEQEPWSTCEPW